MSVLLRRAVVSSRGDETPLPKAPKAPVTEAKAKRPRLTPPASSTAPKQGAPSPTALSEARQWLSTMPGIVWQTMSSLPEDVKEQAWSDLVARVNAWLQANTLEDPELDPEEDVGDSEVETPLEAAVDDRLRKPPPDGYPSGWRLAPGSRGFNAHAREMYAHRGSWTVPHLPLLPQQHVVAFMLHPSAPVNRLLVDHATGSGKTLQILALTELYFFDDRPLVLVFPKAHVCANFYRTRLEWPGRWRDFWCIRDPKGAAIASGVADWRQRRAERWDLSVNNKAVARAMEQERLSLTQLMTRLVKSVREVLELKRTFRCGAMLDRRLDNWPADEFFPAAPLRAYNFTSAGGRAASLADDGRPLSAIFKIQYDGQNVYSNKVVAMDEGHHLTRPHPQYEMQLSNLRDLLYRAENTVLACFTGTIAGSSAGDAQKLLDQVKGAACVAQGSSDEGFLSCYHASTSKPREMPVGVTAGGLGEDILEQMTRSVHLCREHLQRYMIQEARLALEDADNHVEAEKLQNYSNLYVYAGSFGNASCKSSILGDVDRLAIQRRFALKLAAVVEHVRRHPVKALVMVSRRNGYVALLNMLRKAALQHGFSVAEVSDLEEFNSKANMRGEQLRVCIADTDKVGEGVEFKHVRHHHMVDVALSVPAFKQFAGRSVRAFGHQGLPPSEQEVRFFVWAAKLPDKGEPYVFFVRALCGRWTGPAKRAYAGEPAAAEVEELARKLVNQYSSADDLDELKDVVSMDMPVESELPSKLQKRLEKAYEVLEGTVDTYELALDAADEQLLERLVEQAQKLTPAVDMLRLQAVDNGLY